MLNKSPKRYRIYSKNTTKITFTNHSRSHHPRSASTTLPDKSIKEIAYEIGYEDIQSFSRFFKKAAGISPSDFKKEI
jgi:AraC-like DNA-binding protein